MIQKPSLTFWTRKQASGTAFRTHNQKILQMSIKILFLLRFN